jgi:hypothetical protein
MAPSTRALALVAAAALLVSLPGLALAQADSGRELLGFDFDGFGVPDFDANATAARSLRIGGLFNASALLPKLNASRIPRPTPVGLNLDHNTTALMGRLGINATTLGVIAQGANLARALNASLAHGTVLNATAAATLRAQLAHAQASFSNLRGVAANLTRAAAALDARATNVTALRTGVARVLGGGGR